MTRLSVLVPPFLPSKTLDMLLKQEHCAHHFIFTSSQDSTNCTIKCTRISHCIKFYNRFKAGLRSILKSTCTTHKSVEQHEDFCELLSGNVASSRQVCLKVKLDHTHVTSPLPTPPVLYDILPPHP